MYTYRYTLALTNITLTVTYLYLFEIFLFRSVLLAVRGECKYWSQRSELADRNSV